MTPNHDGYRANWLLRIWLSAHTIEIYDEKTIFTSANYPIFTEGECFLKSPLFNKKNFENTTEKNLSLEGKRLKQQ